MVAAVAADELKQSGVAAFHPAFHHTGRLAPEDRDLAVAGLASGRVRGCILKVGTVPRVTGRTHSGR
jgi:hypothetical protein